MTLLTVFYENFANKSKRKGKLKLYNLTVLELFWGFILDNMKTIVCWIWVIEQRKVLANDGDDDFFYKYYYI